MGAWQANRRRAKEATDRAQALASRADPRIRVASIEYDLAGEYCDLKFAASDRVGHDWLQQQTAELFEADVEVQQVGDRDRAKALGGEQVRWGLENLDLTAARLKELGLENFTRPVKVSCIDHETGGPIIIQQWDGKKWSMVSDWIPTMRDIVRPMIEEAAAAYAKENNITPRDCA